MGARGRRLRVEHSKIGLEFVRCIALGVERHENWHYAAGARAKLVKCLCRYCKGDRTNIRAVSISEVHQHIFSAKIRVRASFAILIDKRKRAAEIGRRYIRRYRRAWRDQFARTRAREHYC